MKSAWIAVAASLVAMNAFAMEGENTEISATTGSDTVVVKKAKKGNKHGKGKMHHGKKRGKHHDHEAGGADAQAAGAGTSGDAAGSTATPAGTQ